MSPQSQTLIKRLKKAAWAFLIVLVFGMIGYRFLVSNISWFDGFYMTFITVTTIGFEEVVSLEGNTLGRIFTILIAMSGIGILSYSLTNVAALIIEIDINKHWKKKKMEQVIRKIKGHYLICGASKLGIHIAEELEKTKRPFIICDINEEELEGMEDSFEYGMVWLGDCTEESFLEKMNIRNANGVFVSTRNDHNNIVIVVTVRQMMPHIRIVSECLKPENHKKLLRIGADKVISPAYIGGLRMASEMVRPTVTNFLDEMLRDTNQNLRIEEVRIPNNYVGKSIEELHLHQFKNILLLAIRENGLWKYNPDDDYKISPESRLIVMTSPEELVRLERYLNHALQNNF
jgi:voltage-gated potassium channel